MQYSKADQIELRRYLDELSLERLKKESRNAVEMVNHAIGRDIMLNKPISPYIVIGTIASRSGSRKRIDRVQESLAESRFNRPETIAIDTWDGNSPVSSEKTFAIGESIWLKRSIVQVMRDRMIFISSMGKAHTPPAGQHNKHLLVPLAEEDLSEKPLQTDISQDFSEITDVNGIGLWVKHQIGKISCGPVTAVWEGQLSEET